MHCQEDQRPAAGLAAGHLTVAGVGALEVTVIYYGTDQVDYFHHETGRPVPTPEDHQYATIPFWSYFLD
ncbi:hypothetical protein [Streptomyces gibsoniae]|uniref:Uncharacterized protein n=1 Tax=Streptomyces gibsoniae TaxID=3075529 RepID=A0ABU2U840_9ACTN|nr:hypothetical protein [Streptomyces sp. DSM 41699]MDT0469240.1 hypothetical protein [Streptomyces sp. DSM 41699]